MEKAYTISQFAKQIGFDRSTIYRWLKGVKYNDKIVLLEFEQCGSRKYITLKNYEDFKRKLTNLGKITRDNMAADKIVSLNLYSIAK